MPDLADLHASLDELGTCGLDVGDHQVGAPDGSGRRSGEPETDRDRAGRARWRELDDTEVFARLVVDIKREARLVDIKGFGAVHVGNRKQDEFEFHVHHEVSSLVGCTVKRPYSGNSSVSDEIASDGGRDAVAGAVTAGGG